MSLGLVARKVGMTRIFTEDGQSIPVTVLEASANRVTQLKTPETDGYAAVQIGFGSRKPSRTTKALAGHFAKAGVTAARVLREFRVDPAELASLQLGQELSVTMFQPGQKVDVTGLRVDPGKPTGVGIIIKDTRGHNAIVVDMGANSLFGKVDIDAGYEVLRKVIQVFSSPAASKMMVDGNYEVGGIFPLGAA